MNEINFLSKAMGITADVRSWPQASTLPLFLRLAKYSLVSCLNVEFLLVQLEGGLSLPEVKRFYSQVSKRSSCPVAMGLYAVDARQRAALVRQGIPFICAGKQVLLPFLGTAYVEWGSRKSRGNEPAKLSLRAQQAAIWGSMYKAGGRYTLSELREALGVGAGAASEAVSELVERGCATRDKEGRTVYVSPIPVDELLEEHMHELASPLARRMFVRKTPLVKGLPLCGESALAERTMLNAPTIEQRAVSKEQAAGFKECEVVEGELADEEIVELQVWRYPPLSAGEKEITDVSLGLSLCSNSDERVAMELDSLFGKRYPWQKAR